RLFQGAVGAGQIRRVFAEAVEGNDQAARGRYASCGQGDEIRAGRRDSRSVEISAGTGARVCLATRAETRPLGSVLQMNLFGRKRKADPPRFESARSCI